MFINMLIGLFVFSNGLFFLIIGAKAYHAQKRKIFFSDYAFKKSIKKVVPLPSSVS